MNKIKARTSATVANMVCGFDVLGFALNAPFDNVEVILIDSSEIVIHHTDSYGLSENPKENVAGVSLQALMNNSKMLKGKGFEIVIHKNIKPGSGLGSSSSSASIVAVANMLLNNPFSNKELVEFAMEGEAFASGSRHADNVAPCIYGGVTIVRNQNGLDIIPMKAPDVWVAVVHPQIEVKTADARRILPLEIKLKEAVNNWSNVAGLVAGIAQNDLEIISRCMKDDIIEPLRKKLIPGFDEVKERSLRAGALCGGISGSGPSIFMLCKNESDALLVTNEMESVYKNLDIDSLTYVTTINQNGAVIY